MGSTLDTLFTQEDGAALSAALLEQFPEAVFIEGVATPWPAISRRANLAECETTWGHVLFPPKRWHPQFTRNADGNYYPNNHGSRLLWYLSKNWTPLRKGAYSENLDSEPSPICEGALHISYDRLTPELKSFDAQVWQIFDTVVSFDLLEVGIPSRRVIGRVNRDRRWFAAGHHAILWAAGAPDRLLRYYSYPDKKNTPDIGWGIYPAPEAIAAARATVLGEASFTQQAGDTEKTTAPTISKHKSFEAFHLNARVRAADGSIRPFEMHVSAPEPTADALSYNCRITCASLLFHERPVSFDERPIYGESPDQAYAGALWILEAQLDGRNCTLIDDDENPIELPIDRSEVPPRQPT